MTARLAEIRAAVEFAKGKAARFPLTPAEEDRAWLLQLLHDGGYDQEAKDVARERGQFLLRAMDAEAEVARLTEALRDVGGLARRGMNYPPEDAHESQVMLRQFASIVQRALSADTEAPGADATGGAAPEREA